MSQLDTTGTAIMEKHDLLVKELHETVADAVGEVADATSAFDHGITEPTKTDMEEATKAIAHAVELNYQANVKHHALRLAHAADEPAELDGNVLDDTSHTCKETGFDAATDTCPGCLIDNLTVGDKDAKKNPYRHVCATRWMVHHLLRYHYLPYWPPNVDKVFATVDIRTGKVVAACVYAYPVLRCNLRESVFGKLTPETLNRDFRQLVRLMVDPDHRFAGVARQLLRWSFTKIEQPVVEAINRSWVPTQIFIDEKMIERVDKDRHYYYRLKSARSRVDEIANPPAGIPVPAALKDSGFPRLWIRHETIPGQEQVVYQAYDRADPIFYTWGKKSLVITREKARADDGSFDEAPAFRMVTDEAERLQLLIQIDRPVPPGLN